MIAVGQAPPEAEIFAGLNNIIARSTSPKKSYESLKSHFKQEDNTSRVQAAPTKPGYRLWPSLRKTSATSGRGNAEPGKPTKNPFKDGGLARCRKISVPDLGQLSTIDEKQLDSPTLPQQFPIHERSNSAPGVCGGISTGPPASIGLEEPSRNMADLHSEVPSPSRRVVRQKSKANIAPHQPQCDLPPSSTLPKKFSHDERPEVPPKSPRLALRIPNIPPFSAIGDITSDISTPTIGSQGSKLVDSPWKSSPNLPAQVYHAGSPSTPPSSEGSIISTPSPMIPGSSPYKRTRTDDLNYSAVEPVSDGNNHKRGQSHESALKWGKHLPRDYIGYGNRLPSGEITSQVSGCSAPGFPVGIPVHRAHGILPRREIDTLQKQAHNQAQKYEVLYRCDVKSLSRELRLLQQRCDYLRETYNSLRAGRHSLHKRMISYLKSPRVAKFSREGVLKQEEALFELDKSIDEWYIKMERAEQRRNFIRQRLLEHVAATLVLRGMQLDSVQRTPPTEAPSKPNTNTGASRKDVESIKVYADSEIQALFANIEMDMERMACGSPTLLPAVAFSPPSASKVMV